MIHLKYKVMTNWNLLIESSRLDVFDNFILPLLCIDFKEYSYKEIRMTKDRDALVLITDNPESYKNRKDYLATYVNDEDFAVILSIEYEFLDDVENIMIGRYSKVSDKGRSNILNFSPLTNEHNTTNVLLAALRPQSRVGKMWRKTIENLLDARVKGELISKPKRKDVLWKL